MLGQISYKIRFYSKFPNISKKKFDFGEIFEKFRFKQNVRKFPEISISVKISKYFDFCETFQKFSNLIKFRKNFAFYQIFEKFRFFRKFVKFRFSKIFEKFDFGPIFQNLMYENFEKFRFRSKFRNISISVKIFKNF